MRSSLAAVGVIILFGMLSFSKTVKLKVTSPSFENNGMMPSKYSCEGLGTNPPLNITGIPSSAACLAMIVHDPDAPMKGGFTHWVVWNLGIDGNIPENYNGDMQGLNSMKENQYKGACPPSGTHHYHFMVYALDKKLDLDKATDKAGLEKAIKGHILAKGELVGLYKKANPDSTH